MAASSFLTRLISAEVTSVLDLISSLCSLLFNRRPIFLEITPGWAGPSRKNLCELLLCGLYRLDSLSVTRPTVSKHWRIT